jgi:hypothetical protein
MKEASGHAQKVQHWQNVTDVIEAAAATAAKRAMVGSGTEWDLDWGHHDGDVALAVLWAVAGWQ